MSTITVWNKGKRSWPVKNENNELMHLNPQESVEMDEVKGLRLIASYPKDFTSTKVASPNFTDLKRREQSIHDREKNLDEREKAIEAREKAFADSPKRGRPKADKPAELDGE